MGFQTGELRELRELAEAKLKFSIGRSGHFNPQVMSQNDRQEEGTCSCHNRESCFS